MSDASTRLLQMLEPAVRPGQASRSSTGSATPDATAAFESKSFEELFRELSDTPPAATQPTAASSADAGEETQASGSRAAADPLAPLHTIENASLTRLLADRPGPTQPPDPTGTARNRAA